MAKAARVLAALQRNGWVEIRRTGSHRTLEKNGIRRVFSHHDTEDLGGPMMARIAREFGYTLAELRHMV